MFERCPQYLHSYSHTLYGCLRAAYWNNTQCNNVCDIAVIALPCSCYIGRKLWISIRDLLYMNNLRNNNNNSLWTNSECQTFRVRMRLCHGSRQRSPYRAVENVSEMKYYKCKAMHKCAHYVYYLALVTMRLLHSCSSLLSQLQAVQL